jgi:type I restriction enzyme S subunit
MTHQTQELPGSALRDEGPIVIGAKDISKDQRLDLSSPTYLSREKFEESPEIKVQRSDVLVVKVGNTIGKVAYVKDDIGEACINPNTVIVRPRSVEPRYVYYVLTSDQGQHFLKSNSSASAQPAINQATIKALLFRMPEASLQKSIAEALGALDDKIDLNRRMNETLEAMARAIFRDWFVDFGPTRAKMEGRAPYLAPNIWALFPDRLDDEERPEEWKTGTLGNYSRLNPESWSRSNYPQAIKYVDLSGTKWGSIESIECLSRSDAPSRAQRILRAGDTIVGMVRPGNGSYAFVSEEGLTGSTGFAVLRPTHPHVREFVYLAAVSPENIERLAHLADGAAYPAVRPEVIMATDVVTASDPTMKAFSLTVGPLIERIEMNKKEASTLAAARDLLLPKLLSGEICIKQAEKALEAAQ